MAVADQSISNSGTRRTTQAPILTAALRQNKIVLQIRGFFAEVIDLDTSDDLDPESTWLRLECFHASSNTVEREFDLQSVAHRFPRPPLMIKRWPSPFQPISVLVLFLRCFR